MARRSNRAQVEARGWLRVPDHGSMDKPEAVARVGSECAERLGLGLNRGHNRAEMVRPERESADIRANVDDTPSGLRRESRPAIFAVRDLPYDHPCGRRIGRRETHTAEARRPG